MASAQFCAQRSSGKLEVYLGLDAIPHGRQMWHSCGKGQVQNCRREAMKPSRAIRADERCRDTLGSEQLALAVVEVF